MPCCRDVAVAGSVAPAASGVVGDGGAEVWSASQQLPKAGQGSGAWACAASSGEQRCRQDQKHH